MWGVGGGGDEGWDRGREGRGCEDKSGDVPETLEEEKRGECSCRYPVTRWQE